MIKEFLKKFSPVFISLLIIAALVLYIIYIVRAKSIPPVTTAILITPLIISIILVIYIMIDKIISIVKEQRENSDKNK